ncbi:MAG: cyclic nucleotide-binding domain-containing protein [Desulforhabdus sp.]|nr:cyclic nucleotide-binding domain-containing protein [Desulforhabdus sp.]
MEGLSWLHMVWAILLGALSAVSLPLGSLVGLRTNPRSLYISILAAFGAGALIAALSVELVAPTVAALEKEAVRSHPGDPYENFFALLLGATLGGILFVILDQIVNAHGGFLRKTATAITYFRTTKRRRLQKLLQELSRFPLLQSAPADHINSLLALVRPVAFHPGEVITRQDFGIDSLLFILEGTISATRDGQQLTEASGGNVLGIIPFLTDLPSPATVTAVDTVTGVSLSRADFEGLRVLSPEFDQACRELAGQRLELLQQHVSSRQERAVSWAKSAVQALRTGTDIPTAVDLRRAEKEHGGAPLAIWLGILIDGIPESFVIGAGLLVLLEAKASAAHAVRFMEVIPFTLIAGLFLSNFPEALSSSVNMQRLGWNWKRIISMWFSLMIITALGAGFGYLLAGALHHGWLVFAEGLAAGAMLTMIAAAMIPEAVHIGNSSAVGLSTLAGFLAAILFKLFE